MNKPPTSAIITLRAQLSAELSVIGEARVQAGQRLLWRLRAAVEALEGLLLYTLLVAGVDTRAIPTRELVFVRRVMRNANGRIDKIPRELDRHGALLGRRGSRGGWREDNASNEEELLSQVSRSLMAEVVEGVLTVLKKRILAVALKVAERI